MSTARPVVLFLAGWVAMFSDAGSACSDEASGIDAVSADQEPIRLCLGPHLFIDDYLIKQSSNLSRTTHQPEKLAQPILAKAESWHQQPLFFQKVIYDPRSRKFRMWYNVKNPGASPSVCFCYAESDDGIQWIRPFLGIVSVGGSTKNNIIDAPFGHFGLFFIDEGASHAEPSRRYKMAYYNQGNGPAGLHVALSGDGFHFTPYSENPVIGGDEGTPYEPGYANVISDIIDGCWDPLRNQYLLGCKIEAGGYPGKPHFHAEGWRRTVGMSVSKDFVHWRRPWQIVTPDPKNGIEEFYGFQPTVRGNLYLGFMRVLRDDLPADEGGPAEGIGWTELITSRDGEKWTRCQDKFLNRNLQPGTWDHAMAWAGTPLTVGEKDYIYYCGYSAGHKVGDRQNGLAILRKNGFVSRDAGTNGGLLITPSVILSGNRMTINAKVDGELRVRLCDDDGKRIAGFDAEDCRPVQGDSLAHPIEWEEPLSTLGGRAIRIEFLMRDAELYGFELSE